MRGCVRVRFFYYTLMFFIFLLLNSSCASTIVDRGAPSPCVGVNRAPCVKRPINPDFIEVF
jgi:hypothetical protein